MVTNFSKEPQKEEINDDDEIWMWKRNMNIGTWNVTSLFWSGALKVLHNELLKLDFDHSSTSRDTIGKLYTKI